MRILHIFDHGAPLQSGYVSRSLSILRAQRALGLDPVCLTSPRHGFAAGPPEAPVEEDAGFRFYRTPAPGRSLPGLGLSAEMKATTRRIGEAIEAEEPDAIHAHSPVLNALPAIRAGRRARLPVVYEIRAFWEDAAVDHGSTRPGSPRYRLTRAMETRACRKADAIFTISHGLRDDLIARGIAPEKVALAPNAIEPARLAPIEAVDAELRDTLGLGEGPVIGFLGSFYRYEGLDLLIEAFPAIREVFPSARLLMVGGGPQDEALRAAAAILGEAAVFTGRVPPEAVRAHYSLFDLLVYPRLSMRLTEIVTPLKPLEAMALNRRFIASDVGGHRELIEDGRTGRLFAAGDADALARAAVGALRESNAPEDQGILGRALAFVREERSWSAVARRYAPVYERLLSR